jgi:hypothetical protein
MTQQSKHNLALKEWALVVKALDAGRQIILLRKGGIHEKKGKFVTTHTEFFLFPTYVHQMAQGVIAEAAEDWQRTETEQSPNDLLEIYNYATAEDGVWLDNLERLSSLQRFHIWTPETISRRFFYKNHGLHLFLLRVYRLPQTHTLPVLKRYAGCRSWVELEKKIPTAGAMPVLSDEAFALRVQEVRKVLAGSLAA